VEIERFENLLRLILNGRGIFRFGCQVGATTKGAAIAVSLLVTAIVLAGLPVVGLSTVIHPRMAVGTGCHVQVEIGLVRAAISDAGADRSSPRKEERQT